MITIIVSKLVDYNVMVNISDYKTRPYNQNHSKITEKYLDINLFGFVKKCILNLLQGSIWFHPEKFIVIG